MPNTIKFECSIWAIGYKNGTAMLLLDNRLMLQGDGVVELAERYEAETGTHIPRATWIGKGWLLETGVIEVDHDG